MFKIPEWVQRDYLQVNSMKNFCAERELKVSESKSNLIAQIIEYAGEVKTSENYQEVFQWLLKTIKEGSKDICYKKVYSDEWTVQRAKDRIDSIYPECQQKDILNAKVGEEYQLIEYQLVGEEKLREARFVFAKKVLEKLGSNDLGTEEVYPVYFDVYFKEGFIVWRTQPKAWLYGFNQQKVVVKEQKINTLNDSYTLMGKIIDIFELECDKKSSRQKTMKMLYEIYSKHGSTPPSVQKKIDTLEDETKKYIFSVFTKLGLDVNNIPKAFKDLEIFLEKYISIETSMENEFKEGRDAYIIKIASDDALQLTKIDAMSALAKPLQCTDIFYDSKKSILNTKECKKLNLCYNRKRGYLGPFLVQLDVRDNFGMIKIKYFAEEVDIQSVLQTVFENY